MIDAVPSSSCENLNSGFTVVPAGEYRMGSEHDGPTEAPVHKVHVSAFLCARTAVTRGEFRTFLEEISSAELELWGLSANDVLALGELKWNRGEAEPDWRDHPVVGVSWFDACAYARWLSAKTALPYRLPTEAEWERAARGGLDRAPFPWGHAPADRVGANFGHLGNMSVPHTVRCDALPRNGFGLFMGGNCWEWVNDWYDPHYYQSSPPRDPLGPESGRFKVRRGGAFNNRQAFRLGVASRNRLEPDRRFPNMGFRLVRTADTSETVALSAVAVHSIRGAERWIPSQADWDRAITERLSGTRSLREKVEAVLDVLRPSMTVDEGGVQVESVRDDIVQLLMVGTCRSCPKSAMTFADMTATLMRHLPELSRVERVGQ